MGFDIVNYKELAELAREEHQRIAGHEDSNVSGGWTDSYQNSQAAFISLIKAGWPELDAYKVYDVWSNCMESVAHCANVRILHAAWDKGELSGRADARVAHAAGRAGRDSTLVQRRAENFYPNHKVAQDEYVRAYHLGWMEETDLVCNY